MPIFIMTIKQKVIKPLLLSLIALLLLCMKVGLAQSYIIDSLTIELSKTTNIDKRLDLQIYLAHYYAGKNNDSAKYYSQNLINQGKKFDKRKIQLYGYLKYALAYYTYIGGSNIDSCEIYLDSAKLIAKKYKIENGLLLVNQFRAVVNEATFNFDEAITYHLLVFEEAKKKNLNNYIGITIRNLADIYQTSGQIQKAINFIQENDSIMQLIDEPYQHFTIKWFLSNLYIKNINYNKALTILHQLKKSYFFTPGLFRIDQMIGYCYFKQNQLDSANYYFNLTKAYSTDSLKTKIYSNDYNLLAEYLINKKEYVTADKYLKASMDHFKNNSQLIDLEIQSLKNYIELFKSKNKYDSAFIYISRYNDIKDSLKINGLGHVIDKTMAAQELEKSKNEVLELIHKQNNLVTKKHILVAITFTVIIILLTLWYYLTHILKCFEQDFLQKSKSNTWIYKSPAIVVNYKTQTISTIIYFTALTLCQTLFYSNFSNYSYLIIWIFLSSLLYMFISFSYKLIINKNPEINLIQNLLSYTIIAFTNIVLSLILFKTIVENSTIKYLFDNVIYSLIISQGIVHIFIIQFQYQKGIKKLNNNLLIQFNKQLIKKQENTLSTNKHHVNQKNNIIVDNMGQKLKLDTDNILYVTSDNVYQEFIYDMGVKIDKILVRNTLNNIEQLLSEFPQFTRCHRSFIVNTKKVERIIGNSRQYYFKFKNNADRVPLSRTTPQQFIEEYLQNG